jgi:hypothetical protein
MDLEMDIDYARYLNNIGCAYANNKQYEEALDFIDRSIKIK